MRFHSKYELREIFPQVHHVGKQLSILINRMIVIIREEIFQSVREIRHLHSLSTNIAAFVSHTD